MQTKTVSGVQAKNQNLQSYPEQDGTLSSDGKYVAVAYARLLRNATWRKNEDTGRQSRMVGRFDITVSEWDGEQQGGDVISYCGGRILELEGKRLMLGGPFDNTSNRQFKNLIVSSTINDAVESEIARAYDDLKNKLKNGEEIRSGVSFIENADEFITMAEKLIQSAPAVPTATTQQVAEKSDQVAGLSELDQAFEESK